RNNYCNPVRTIRSADGTNGFLILHRSRNVEIRCGFSERNRCEFIPDLLLECCADRSNGNRKYFSRAEKIFVELFFRLIKKWIVLFRSGFFFDKVYRRDCIMRCKDLKSTDG